MMGVFATFVGLMYNDFTSIPLHLSHSCVKLDTVETTCVYPIGVDQKWYLASNQLAFMNSLKMKIAVIFGVA